MKKLLKPLLSGVFAVSLAAPALADNGATGVWITRNGTVTVRLVPRGPALCGTIVFVRAH